MIWVLLVRPVMQMIYFSYFIAEHPELCSATLKCSGATATATPTRL